MLAVEPRTAGQAGLPAGKQGNSQPWIPAQPTAFGLPTILTFSRVLLGYQEITLEVRSWLLANMTPQTHMQCTSSNLSGMCWRFIWWAVFQHVKIPLSIKWKFICHRIILHLMNYHQQHSLNKEKNVKTITKPSSCTWKALLLVDTLAHAPLDNVLNNFWDCIWKPNSTAGILPPWYEYHCSGQA